MTRKLTAKILQERFGVSLRTLSRWVDAGVLPQPVRLNGGYRFWDEDEVENAFKARVTPVATPGPIQKAR